MCSNGLMIAFGTASGALALSGVAFVLSVWAIAYTRMQAEAARSANAPEVAATLTLSYMHGTIALSENGILTVTFTSKHHVRSCSVELLDGADLIGAPIRARLDPSHASVWPTYAGSGTSGQGYGSDASTSSGTGNGGRLRCEPSRLA
jgi:hypothetical protein